MNQEQNADAKESPADRDTKTRESVSDSELPDGIVPEDPMNTDE